MKRTHDSGEVRRPQQWAGPPDFTGNRKDRFRAAVLAAIGVKKAQFAKQFRARNAE
jgi:hypothetical protein